MAAFNAQPAFQKQFGVEVSPGQYELEAKWQVALANASKIGIMLGLFVSRRLCPFFQAALTEVVDKRHHDRSIWLQASHACSSVRVHLLQLHGLLRNASRSPFRGGTAPWSPSRCLQVSSGNASGDRGNLYLTNMM